MTDKLIAAAEMALEALQDIIHWYSERDQNDKVLPPYNQTPEILEAIQAVQALRQALDQLPDATEMIEPICYAYKNEVYGMAHGYYSTCEIYPANDTGRIPLYTAPPKQEWKNLDFEEIAEAGKFSTEGDRMLPCTFARAIEAKLKEKNT